jgi:hypothetical protein
VTALNVVVSGPRAECDVVLPDDVAVGELLPGLALSYAGADADSVVVSVSGLGVLDPHIALAAAGVRHGAILNVFPADELPTSLTMPPHQARLIVAPERRPPPLRALARASSDGGGGWAWLGAHGGAGVTSLAYCAGGAEADRSDPAAIGTPIIVVARTHASGLTAAQDVAVTALAGLSPAWECLGLVTVADGPGRAPRRIVDLRRLVAGGYPRVWHVPWIEPWRFGDLTADGPEVRRLTRALVRASASSSHP